MKNTGIVVAAVSIVLKFAVLVSYSADVLSDVAVNVLIKALSGVWVCVIIDVVVAGIGFDVLVGVIVNIFAAVITALRCTGPAPVEAFSSWTA